MKDSHVQMSHEWLTMVCDTLTHRTHSHWETFRMILILFGCVLWTTSSSSRFVWQCHLHKYGKSWAATFSYASLQGQRLIWKISSYLTPSLYLSVTFSARQTFSHAPADFSVGFGDGLLPVQYVRSGMQIIIIIIIIGCCTIALRASYCHLFGAEVIHRTKQSSVWAEFAKGERKLFLFTNPRHGIDAMCAIKRESYRTDLVVQRIKKQEEKNRENYFCEYVMLSPDEQLPFDDACTQTHFSQP